MPNVELDDYASPGSRFTQNGFCTGQGQGMSMRDYFAGQALAGILAGGFADTIPHDGISGGKEAAFYAFQYADAMLAVRASD